MKTALISILIFFILLSYNVKSAQSSAIIIDHTCCNLTKVPDNFVNSAKNQFRIAYGHTSHGSQIITGMNLLSAIPNSIYKFNGETGSLFLNDASLLPGDLGNPDRTKWAEYTRSVLNNNQKNINMIIWSWCGQVAGSESDIITYLDLMSQLEEDFPIIKFVYMTGHLDGSGITGIVNLRNEQIRKFCKDNGKILFDFADIESYDPDGKYFLDKKANDNCDYYDGSIQKNWAQEWCEKNPDKCETSCSCAHSQCLNCQQKGKAFWWMMARITGWDGISTEVNFNYLNEKSAFTISPNPVNDILKIDFNLIQYDFISIEIFNNFGNKIYATNIMNSTKSKFYEINTSEFPQGFYYCAIKSVLTTKLLKFIVQR
jgi:hypothetical protein